VSPQTVRQILIRVHRVSRALARAIEIDRGRRRARARRASPGRAPRVARPRARRERLGRRDGASASHRGASTCDDALRGARDRARRNRARSDCG
jgi:hypothetical protein